MTSGDHVTVPQSSALKLGDSTVSHVEGTINETTDDMQYNASKIYAEWIFCEIVTICLSIILLYITVSLTVFLIRRVGHLKRSSGNPMPSSRRNDTILSGLTLAATVFTFIRCFLDIDTIFGRYSEISCSYLKKPKIGIAFVALLFGILTYWLRQRMIYGSTHMKHLVNRCTRFISIGIFPCLGVLFLAGLLFFMIQDVGYRPLLPYGCSESTNIVPFLLVALTIFLSQVTLVLLLVYPILKRRRNSSVKGSIRAKQNEKQRKLMLLVWKAFTTALIAVITNLVALVIIALVPTQVDDIGMVIVDINLTILVFCTILSNAECKKRLCPFYRAEKSHYESSFVTSSSTNIRGNIRVDNVLTQTTPVTAKRTKHSVKSSNSS